MLKAFARVAARSITIQLDQAAANARARQGTRWHNGLERVHGTIRPIEPGKGIPSSESPGKQASANETTQSNADGESLPETIAQKKNEAVMDKTTLPDSTAVDANAQEKSTPHVEFDRSISQEPISTATEPSKISKVDTTSTTPNQPHMASAPLETANPTEPIIEPLATAQDEPEPPSPVLRPSRVPSSRLGRLFHYGSLVAGLSVGAASEVMRRSAGGASTGSVFMSEANVRRLVGKLSQMRGAALKLGQFMSIQGEKCGTAIGMIV